MLDFVMQLAGRAPMVLSILAFRLVPFVAYALFASRVGRAGKLVAVGLFLGLLGLLHAVGGNIYEPGLRTPLALVYFALAACGVYGLRDLLERRRLSKPALFALLAAMFVAVPAVLVPSSVVLATLVVGWDAMFAGYSYCVDNASSRKRPSLRDCLFFMLVNPTLVYSERGERVAEPALRARSLGRVSLGVLTMLAQDAVLLGATALSADAAIFRAMGGAGDYFAFTVVQSSRGLGMYLAHSGLASMQIGLMGLVGYQVPERYHYPFLATGPADFWRRWNIWLGSWAKRYLYYPSALKLGRRFRRQRPEVAKALALAGTFLAIGVLHDFATYWSRLHAPQANGISIVVTAAFAFMVLVFLIWIGVGMLLGRAAPRARREGRWTQLISLLVSWLVFVQLLQVIVWIAGPTSDSQAGRSLELSDLLAAVGALLP